MNDAQFEIYSAYLRQLADALLLADWEITLKRDFSGGDTFASVYVMNCENHAFIRFSEEFFAHPREEHREWCCHELLHAQLDRVDRVMVKLKEQFSDNSATDYAAKMHVDEVEICVQRLARIIAPMMPLPPEIEG